MTPKDFPGLPQAAAAIKRMSGDRLTDAAAFTLALVALQAAAPHLKVEAISDLADEMTANLDALAVGGDRETIQRLATEFDQVAAEMREALM